MLLRHCAAIVRCCVAALLLALGTAAASPPPVHTVGRGDTLARIARHYGVSIDALIRYNRLADPDRIAPGDRLAIPPRDAAAGQVHTVQVGESLTTIARRYEVTVPALIAANALARPDRLAVGQRLQIPVAAAAAPALAPPQSGAAAPAFPGDDPFIHVVEPGETLLDIARRYQLTPEDLQRYNGIADPGQLAVGDRLAIPGLAGTAAVELIWPLGELTVLSGSEPGEGDPHSGLDLGAPKHTPVRAAAAGVVTFSGRRPELGNVVIIEHAEGVRTLYAHNRENLVQEGQLVVQGQYIATVGRSGGVSTDRLHFEYIERGQSIDPRIRIAPDAFYR